MPKLIVRIESLGEASENHFSWFIFANSGVLDASGSGNAGVFLEHISELDDWCREPENVSVLVPGAQVVYLEATVPGRSSGQIKKALPYIVEEYLAEDIDDVHIAHKSIKRGSSVKCCAVSRAQIHSWQSELRECGTEAGLMIADADALPEIQDQLHILIGQELTFLRAPGLMLSCDRENLFSILNAYLNEQFPNEDSDKTEGEQAISTVQLSIHLHYGDLSKLEKSQVESTFEIVIDWIVHPAQYNSETEYLAQSLIEKQHKADLDMPLNLLQGDYQALKSNNNTWLKWRSVAVLALALCVVLLTTETAKSMWLGYKADEFNSQSMLLYKDIFKKDRRVTAATLKRRMAAHLGEEGATQAQFLSTLGKISKVFAAQSAQPLLENLSYNNTRGELLTQVQVANFEALERIKAALIAAGLAVDIRTAEQKGSSVTARLQVKT